MDEILDALTQTPGIQGAVIVGRDGLVIASAGKTGEDADLVGATGAEMFTNAESASADRLGRGAVGSLTMEAAGGCLLARPIDEVTVLLVLTEEKINLGLVRFETRRAAEKLRDSL